MPIPGHDNKDGLPPARAQLERTEDGLVTREPSNSQGVGDMSGGRYVSANDRNTLVAELSARAVREQTTAGFLGDAGPLLFDTAEVGRVFLSLQALHPAFRARTYLWRRGAKQVRMEEWPHGLKNRPGYYDSPDFHVHSTRTELRIADLKTIEGHRCDLYEELRGQGYTDYLMVPLFFSDGTVNTFSIATKRRDGFSSGGLARFRRATESLAVILERYTALETVASTLNTYLGRSVSREILQGHIRAGHGELIEAVILFADLHDFSGHATLLDPVGTVRLLNDYFDCLVGPIEQHDGYVLKFIGDAVLAFFPGDERGASPANPMGAVHEIRQRLAHLNHARADKGEPPLRQGMCLHFGRVLYGNVGSSERLDFTIIGQDVNVAARGVEATKTFDADYLFTGEFVARFGNSGLVPIGARKFQGIPEPVALYRLAAEPGDFTDGQGELRRERGPVGEVLSAGRSAVP